MSERTINLTPNLYEYLIKNSLREPDILKQLRDESKKTNVAKMQISPEQGQFMRLLVEILGARKTLDIGTFIGYSALSVALALPEEGKVIACDINIKWTTIAKHYWHLANVAHKIELKLAPALETLTNLLVAGQQNSFDFIFIDADKKNNIAYYDHAYLLLRPGGLIAIDNVLWSGKVADETNNNPSTILIRTLNERIHQDLRVSISMVPIGDGLTLIRKK